MAVKKDRVSILIPDGESGQALPVIECLSRIPNIDIFILSSDPYAITRFTKHKSGFFYRGNAESDQAWIDDILQYVTRLRIDLIFPVGQFAVRLLSASEEWLPSGVHITPVPATSSFDIASDKWLLAEFMSTMNLPLPPTLHFDSFEKAEQSLSTLTFPVLTKPRNEGNGIGIKYWGERSDLLQYLEQREDVSDLIIQAYIVGKNIDCSVLCRDGVILAHTIQEAIVPGKTQFSAASGIRFVQNDEVYNIVEKLMSALKWSGIAHIDLMYDEQENIYRVIEINPRYWATLLGSLRAGVNFPHLAYLDSMDIPFGKPDYSPILYLSVAVGLRMLIRGTSNPLKQNVQMRNTNAPYLFRDPLPSIIKFGKKFKKQILRFSRPEQGQA